MPLDRLSQNRVRTAGYQHPSSVLILLVALALAGCQTTAAPTSIESDTVAAPPPALPPASALSDAPGRVIAENRGWVVTAYPPSPTGRAYCTASRQGDGSPLLSFRATAERAALLVMTDHTAMPDRQAQPHGPGELTAKFSDGVEHQLKAMKTEDGGVIVPVELPTYDDLMEPFAESKTVTLEGNVLSGPVGDINLGGSNWAINALAECRILHTRG